MIPPIHSKCCEKCKGPRHIICINEGCSCHQQQEEKCEHGISFKKNCVGCYERNKAIFDHPKTPQEGGISLGSAAQWAKTEQEPVQVTVQVQSKSEGSWEERFDKEVIKGSLISVGDYRNIKAFIRTEKEKSYQEGLNEPRNKPIMLSGNEANAFEAGKKEGYREGYGEGLKASADNPSL